MMAQNCLIPKGPPKFDTVNVPPYKKSKPSTQQHSHETVGNKEQKNILF